MSGIIIMGSSRSDGDTAAVVKSLAKKNGFAVLDLRNLTFTDYDYQAENLDDDFLPTIRDVVANYQTVVLATPVYWYTMSALMKRFLDRISDCLRVEKETGRKLRGMELAILSVSNDQQPPCFTKPFELSAEYLGMQYLGDQHVIVGLDDQPSLKDQLKELIIKLQVISKESC